MLRHLVATFRWFQASDKFQTFLTLKWNFLPLFLLSHLFHPFFLFHSLCLDSNLIFIQHLFECWNSLLIQPIENRLQMTEQFLPGCGVSMWPSAFLSFVTNKRLCMFFRLHFIYQSIFLTFVEDICWRNWVVEEIPARSQQKVKIFKVDNYIELSVCE